FDAAAVCTSPVCPSIRMVSTMPSAVRGFTKHEAASTGAVPSGRTRHCWAAMQRYCAYMAPPRMPTTLPRSACAASDAPAATTTPPPSFPAGMVRPRRPAAACIASGESVARTAGAATRVSRTSVLISARANMTPKSDGLMGAASIRTTTSSGPGAGRSVSTRARVTVLSVCTVEWSCRVWVGVIAINPCLDGLEPVHVPRVRVTRHEPMPAHDLEEKPLHAKGPLRSNVLGWHYKVQPGGDQDHRLAHIGRPNQLSERQPRPAEHVSRHGGNYALGTPQGVERSARHVWA